MNSQKVLTGILLVLGGLLAYSIYEKKKVVEAPPKIPQIQVPITPTFPDEPEEKSFSFEEALNTVDENAIKDNLTYLASDELEGRMSGKSGNIKAFEWLKKQFEDLGYNVEMQKFSIRGGVNNGPKNEVGDSYSQNLIAWLPGNELKNEIIVVGAHGDHIGYGPSYSRTPNRREVHNGADDNASGTTVALEMAKVIAKLKDKIKRTWCFQIYSGEEMGLVGSRYYVKNPMLPKESPSIRNHILMLNMDMVGYLSNRQYMASYYVGESSAPSVDGIINKLSNKYPFAQRITSRRSGGSDHASYLSAGVPVVMLHTGMHAYYHTPDDDASRINFDGMEQISKYALEILWQVDQDSSKPTFNPGALKNLDLTRDHNFVKFSEGIKE